MFCPEGFASVASLEYRLPLDVQEALLEHSLKFYKENDSYEDRGMRFFLKWSPADSFESTMLTSVFDEIYLCSPSGQVLKIDLRALKETIDFWEFSVADLESISEKYAGYGRHPDHFRYAYKLFDYRINDFISEYEIAAERENKTVLDFAEDLSLTYHHQVIPMFYERMGYTINLDAYDFFAKFDFIEMPEYRNIARILRPFEGWAMCVKERFLDGGWIDRLKGQLNKKVAPSPNGVGRPATVRVETLATYQRLYPNGHGQLSWLQALKAVNDSTGYGASLDTLKRALRYQPTGQNSD